MLLSRSAVPGDTAEAEPVDTLVTAQNPGVLTATPPSFADVVQTGDIDVYKFTLVADSTMTVDITAMTGFRSSWAIHST